MRRPPASCPSAARAIAGLTALGLLACQGQPAPAPPAEAPPQAPETAAPADAPTPPPTPTDALRRVGVAALRAALDKPQHPVVIDTRPLADYEAFHIPGAIQRDPWQLTTSAAARAGDPVIVGPGHGLGRLGDALVALRDQGRDLRLLDGGMAAWCRAGGPTTAPCAGVDEISSEQLMAARSCGDRAVLVALRPGEDAAGAPEGAHVATWEQPEQLAAAAEQARRASGARQLLVLDRDGGDLAALRLALRDVGAPVFFVRGGLAEVRLASARGAAAGTGTAMVSQGARPERGAAGAKGFTGPKEGCGCL